jgi:MFS family permease
MAVAPQVAPESRPASDLRAHPARTLLNVGVAALAMVATLPGRTHGLGLITEPLLRALHLDRVDYANLNLWATLLGATFCVPWGWLIDRLGARAVLTATLASLGAVVVVMSRLEGEAVFWPLFLLVLLTRGLGQSALSVVSITLLGKSAGQRSGIVVGTYSFLTALGFMGAFAAVKFALEQGNADWRTLWAGIGLLVAALAPLAWLLVRSPKTSPPTTDLSNEDHPYAPRPRAQDQAASQTGLSLWQALLTPAFWVFGLATSLYGLIAAGISLFNQSILQEVGFDRDVFLTITMFMPLVGLASNLATGLLAMRWSHGRLTALAMLILTGALLAFPFVNTLTQVYLYATAMGVAGGMITVIFFGIWGPVFGTRHLGQIQGAAQMLTVFASALGPLLLALCQRWTGSYIPLYQYLAAASGLLAVCAWLVPLPRRSLDVKGDLP